MRKTPEQEEAEEVRELVVGLTAMLAEAMAKDDEARVKEIFHQLNLQYRGDPSSILVLLKASLVLGATFTLRTFEDELNKTTNQNNGENADNDKEN